MSDPSNITNPEHADHHIVSPKIYLIIFGSLLLCTGVTVGAAFIDMGILNPMIALGIACFKAGLVFLWFMHVKYSSRLVKMTLAAGFFTFLALITMTLSDYISRAWGLW